MSFAPITRSAIFQDQSLRRRAGSNSLPQILRLGLLIILSVLCIGLAALPRAGHAARNDAHPAQP